MNALQTYRLRATWELASVGRSLFVLIPAQLVFAATLAIGFGLLIPDVTSATARFLITGTPTMAMLTIGLVLLPQDLARQRENGVDDFLRTIPGSRIAHLAGLLTPHLVMNLPGSLLAVGVAAWYYDLALDPSLLVLPALMMVSVTGASIGNAIAVASPSPVATAMVSQLALFFVMLFSPINYPADRLPGWLQRLHEVLPFEAMAATVRSSLIGDRVPVGDVVHLAMWAIISFAVSAAFARHRS